MVGSRVTNVPSHIRPQCLSSGGRRNGFFHNWLCMVLWMKFWYKWSNKSCSGSSTGNRNWGRPAHDLLKNSFLLVLESENVASTTSPRHKVLHTSYRKAFGLSVWLVFQCEIRCCCLPRKSLDCPGSADAFVF